MLRILGKIFAILFLAAWFFYGFLDNYYVNHTRIPNYATGAIIPYHVKGIIVYINHTEWLLVRYTFAVFLVFATIYAIIVIVYYIKYGYLGKSI